jgi:hypothetical protein
MQKGVRAGIVFVAPVLPIDVGVMARALEKAGLLERLVTRGCFTAQERRWIVKLGVAGSWSRRRAATISATRLKRVMRADFRQWIGRWRDRSCFETSDAGFKLVDERAAGLISSNTTAVFAREDACLASFRRGQSRGIPCVYILPTAHHATVQRWIMREASEFPGAFSDEEIRADFSAVRTGRKDAELATASHIVCPSTFVQQSVLAAGIPSQRVVTMPFAAGAPRGSRSGVLREGICLYAGTISARKGVHRLIRVWKRLGAYRTHRLRLIGDLHLPKKFVAEYRNVFEHVPRMGRDQLATEYCRAQAFVFNALADGFGHVFAEAMACGTPVLASRNCGAPDLITDGVEGRLFDYGDDAGLAAALDWALSRPTQLADMGARARERARRWTWKHFGELFLTWVETVVDRREALGAADHNQ